MSITDELRKWNTGRLRPDHAAALDAIADRIDEQHKHAVMSAMNDALYHANDESMAELGWLRLPKDAEGKAIHVGDVMWQKDRITKRACKAIMGGDYVMLDGIQGAVYAKGLTHYHEPTVEDVLREFAEKIIDSQIPNVHPTYEEAIAEYVAKLRLAGGDE